MAESVVRTKKDGTQYIRLQHPSGILDVVRKRRLVMNRCEHTWYSLYRTYGGWRRGCSHCGKVAR